VWYSALQYMHVVQRFWKYWVKCPGWLQLSNIIEPHPPRKRFPIPQPLPKFSLFPWLKPL
jgi:hypothetical protein